MLEGRTMDRKILKELQRDGRISNVALAERVGMAPSPCLRRVKQLEEQGFVARYVALLDRRKIGFELIAYVEVKVPQILGDEIVQRFNEAVLQEPSIIGCYITAGQFDYLLKVVAPDMDAYAKLVQTTLLKLPGVTDTRSTFVMEIVKDTTELPI
jgi:Lrp/AsnC family transcriptional regulator, leucine-responsive regulatory protein